MNLVPLGDSAVLAYCVSEAKALEFTASLREASEDWLVDVVQAYTSVALYFDLARIRYAAVVEWLHEREARPGGWNLIGRTPLTLVDVADGYFPLRTGDRVRFTRIDVKEFDRLRGNRLK